jgi:MGT family glycosyltransferase
MPQDAPHWAILIVHYAREMARDLLDLARDWTPDLIVRAGSEYGGLVAAERLGLPHASVPTGAWHADYQLRLEAVKQLDALRADFGLPADPEVEMPFRYLNLAFIPPRYHDSTRPLAPTTHFLRPVAFDRSGGETLPSWVTELPDHPTVYATLGTFFTSRTSLYNAMLDGLKGEPINLIVTVGRQQDPARFGPQPSNVHVERYIPQSLLFSHCDLVVAHAGFGTVLGALSHGLPLVVLDVSADHPMHAARCAALGVGRVLDRDGITPETIREAVRAVLADPTYRRNAEELRDEMATLPGLDHAVKLVERLAVETQPIYRQGAV